MHIYIYIYIYIHIYIYTYVDKYIIYVHKYIICDTYTYINISLCMDVCIELHTVSIVQLGSTCLMK